MAPTGGNACGMALIPKGEVSSAKGSSGALPRCGSLPTADAGFSNVVLGFITLLAGQPVARVFRCAGT